MTKQESQDEVDALKTQKTDDLRFIKQTKDSLAEKTRQWGERKKFRMNEIAAMNEAIAILHNDDARDLMRRSFKSQGYSFVQVGLSSHSARASRAAQLLRQTARSAKDVTLIALAAQVDKATPLTDNSPFAAVIGAINNMISLLQREEETDLGQKEECEKYRMEDTRDAIVKAREMDENTETINALLADIEELKKEIVVTIAKIAQTRQELKDATELRTAENTEWVANNKDDAEAYTTIQTGLAVLEKFYKDNMLTPALVQVPGEAPPPPPPTWDTVDDYSKQGEFGRKSIIAILEMIMEDVQKDQAQAKAEEDKAEFDYQAFKLESKGLIQQLLKKKVGLVQTKGGKEGEVAGQKKARGASKKELDGFMAKIADANPGCDYITINYPVKLRNRQIELDGLTKAKAILVGGTFDAGLDPRREMKPGDALLQQSLRR
jgi:hypothetical protein